MMPRTRPIIDPLAQLGDQPLAVERLALRLDEVARALGVSRRAIERERSAGRFPKPDVTIGRMPLWRPETIRAWIEGGSQ
jgi:predicted DNA-binding transcriptional regulator AlpA